MNVWKFIVPRPDESGRTAVVAPPGTSLISAGVVLGGPLVVWGLVPDTETPDSLPLQLLVVNTGMEFDLPEGARFLGTVEATGIIWHVWVIDA